ncbi:MAG TPA: hypothetical protein VNK96_05860 [Fimbriimonadales bacterium]|nr:hypothetical protein [Fimbriimonadales bacterium]
MFEHVVNAFWISFFVSAILSYPCIFLLKKVNARAKVSPFLPAHQQKEGTPNMGGIFVLVGIFVAMALFNGFENRENVLISYLIFTFALIGFVDDYLVPRFTTKRGLGWTIKLAMQALAASCYVWMLGFRPEAWLAAFFVLTFANAVNFTDGLDALVTMTLWIALIPFLVYFYSDGNRALLIVSLAILGSLLPFLYFNAPPAKIFMGDVGALALGAVYGHLFSTTPYKTQTWPWLTSGVFLLELVLVPIQIGAVKTLKRRIFPATPFHHSLEALGWPESRVLWAMILLQMILTSMAFTVMFL